MIEAWSRQAALLPWQEGFGRALGGSLPGRLVTALRDGLRGWLLQHGAGSLAVRHARSLAIASACLLLVASPLVGTGLNALLVLVAAGLAAFAALVDPQPAPATGIELPLIVLVALSVLSVAASPFPVDAAKGLAKLVIYWLAFLAFRVDLATTWGRRAVFGAVLLAGTGQGVLGLWQHHIHVEPLATWEDSSDLLNLTRVYGTLRNPNLLGGYLVPLVPFGLGFAAAARSRLQRLLALGATGAMAVGVVFTYSRGAYLGLAAEAAVLAALGLLALWPHIRADRRVAIGVAAGLGVALVAGALVVSHSPSLQGRIASITSSRGDSSNSFRLNVWHATLRMIKDNWWAGVGVGNNAFRKAYAVYMVSRFEALGAYNVFLEQAAETGIFGLLATLWLLRAAVARALAAFVGPRALPNPDHLWAACAIAALAGIFTHGMFDTVFYRPAVQLLFWLILALVVHLRVPAEAAA